MRPQLTRWRSHPAITIVAAGALVAGVVVGITSASAATTNVGPYVIDGSVPDSDAGSAIPAPAGSVKELGPSNGSTTKIGVVHNALPPMLGLTNPNAQVDLN